MEKVPAPKAATWIMAWIKTYWEPEPADFNALDDPQSNIIGTGGFIAVAVENGVVVGTCALLKMNEANYELAKMAVSEDAKGRGIGRLRGKALVSKAQELAANPRRICRTWC